MGTEIEAAASPTAIRPAANGVVPVKPKSSRRTNTYADLLKPADAAPPAAIGGKLTPRGLAQIAEADALVEAKSGGGKKEYQFNGHGGGEGGATPSNPRDSLPKIEITTDEAAVVDQVIEALGNDPGIFTRDNILVSVLRDEKPLQGIVRPSDAARIARLPLPTLREKIAGNVNLVKTLGDGDDAKELPMHPPDWLVKAAGARGRWPKLRALFGVVETPMLRPDGTILSRPGYDAETGLLFEPRGMFPEIPSEPTQDDAKKACDALLEVAEDFPFKQPSHRSGWLAGVLTPFARFAYHGPAPLFAMDANTRGCGKSLLADATGLIISGAEFPRMTNTSDDDEIRKRITALALEGALYCLLDNIGSGSILGCSSLDAALTATSWKDRILGVSQSTSALPLSITWFATGNNIIYNGDTIRRVVPIRIESPLEKPEEREGFKHPNLLTWIREERGRLIAAALTVLRAYHVAGRPDQKLRTWGSYEAWSAAVRQPIVWAGFTDPAGAREELVEQSDREMGSLRALLAAWQGTAGDEGKTVAEVFRLLDENAAAARIDGGRPGHEALKWGDLRAAIAEVSGKPLGQLPGPRSFGMKLHHMRGRVAGGMRFVADGRSGTKIWKVETAGMPVKATEGDA